MGILALGTLSYNVNDITAHLLGLQLTAAQVLEPRQVRLVPRRLLLPNLLGSSPQSHPYMCKDSLSQVLDSTVCMQTEFVMLRTSASDTAVGLPVLPGKKMSVDTV